MNKIPRLFFVLILMVGLTGAYIGFSEWSEPLSHKFNKWEKNRPLKNFTLPWVKKNRKEAVKFVSLKQFQNEPVILHFMASWCGSCREDKTQLDKLANKTKLKFLVIASYDKAWKLRDSEWVDLDKYMTLVDKDGAVARAYGVRSLPATILVDRGLILKDVIDHPLTEVDIQNIAQQFSNLVQTTLRQPLQNR